MDYATTLEVVRLAEQFHGKFEDAHRESRSRELAGLGKVRRETCETLTPEAEVLFRRLTSFPCLSARPDLAEHFLDGTLAAG